MRSNRNKFEQSSFARELRPDGRQDNSQPRDYQYLTAKYGKYLDQSKLDQSKLDYSTTVERLRDKEKEIEARSSNDEKDEEDQLTEKQPQDMLQPTPTIKRKRKPRKGKSKAKEYMSMLQLVSTILFLAGSLGLISISALRFTAVQTQSIHEAILNFYFLFLGVCQALAMMKIGCVKRNFRFLNYNWGKSLWSFFLCTVSYSTDEKAWIQYVMSVYFFICGVCFAVLAVWFRQRDRDQSEKDEEEMKEFLEDQQNQQDLIDKYVRRLEKGTKAAKSMYAGAKNVAKFVKKADKMLPTVESDQSATESDEEEHKVHKQRKAGKKSRKDLAGQNR